jgi:uncharacterized membrane protein
MTGSATSLGRFPVSAEQRPGVRDERARLRAKQTAQRLRRAPKPSKPDTSSSLFSRRDSAPRDRVRKDSARQEVARRRPAGRRVGLDTPLESRRRVLRGPMVDSETFGRWSEAFARFMGTAWFLVGMTVFVGAWLAWNAFAPAGLQFDPRRLNFTLMTLILSLQASYAAPLILLAQNRQADRDRVTAEQDRDRAERALADTEYLAREVAALRIALGEVATRDFVRSELRALLDEIQPKGQEDNPPRKPEPKMNRKPARKPVDSFGSTRDVEMPTDSG